MIVQGKMPMWLIQDMLRALTAYGLSLSDIAQRSGIGRSTIYRWSTCETSHESTVWIDRYKALEKTLFEVEAENE